MTVPTIPAPKRDSHRPTRLTPPANACDAHCHIFGPAHRFPFAPNRTYTPPDSGLEELEELQRRLGLGRAVFVQATCHGTDNRAMLDALERGEGRYAGVAMIDDTHTNEDLEAMHRLGVRGIRFNFVAHLGGAPDLSRFRRLVDRIAPLGWHVELHFDAKDLSRHTELLAGLPVPFIIDHMARVQAADGIDQEPFRHLLDLIETNPRSWVKISGAERITADGKPPYDDVVPFAQAVVEVAPDRVLWGTDWPHPNVGHMPDDGDLVDILADFVPDVTTRNRILVDNPTVLYDFAS
ncbi:MAG TPA: amidohydrolase family protein [Acidimicrobiia bacterium]|nr:amidohydrolase family protein [Acidimicrobiia bacterium]